jgi:hypothetical protein
MGTILKESSARFLSSSLVWLHNGTLHNGTLQNGTLQNGTLQNGTLQNSTLQNGTLQNVCRYKTVHVTKRYVTERYGYKTVTVTKRYVLRNGTLQNGTWCKTVRSKGKVTGNGTLVKSFMFSSLENVVGCPRLSPFFPFQSFSTGQNRRFFRPIRSCLYTVKNRYNKRLVSLLLSPKNRTSLSHIQPILEAFKVQKP